MTMKLREQSTQGSLRYEQKRWIPEMCLVERTPLYYLKYISLKLYITASYVNYNIYVILDQ